MDYSPYQNRSRRSRRQGGKISIGLFVVSACIGFLLFWGIKSLFFTEEGVASSVSYVANSSRAEVMLSGDSSWGNLSAGSVVTPGDKIRAKKGNTGELTLKNNSQLVLGLGSQVKMGEVKESEEEALAGEIFLEKGPVLLRLQPSFSEDGLKIWLSSDVFLKASEGELFFDSDGIAALSGEGFHLQKVDSEGKVRYSKSIGVAQYLRIDSFSTQGIPEKIKANPLISSQFEQEREAEVPPIEQAPVAIGDVDSPVITAPAANGEIVEVKKTTLLQGTAPEGAEKIVIAFSDTNGNIEEYELKNFSKGDTDWKYTASPTYNNLSEGKNIYKVYAVSAAEEKSAPAVIVLNYTKPDNAAQVFSSAQGNLVITAPNNGNTATQSARVITLAGIAPSNASYVTVVNKTLGTEYTLKGFKKRQKTWKYWTGKMDDGKYVYLVKAQDAKKRTLSSDTITVFVRPSVATSTVSTASTSSTSTAVSDTIDEDEVLPVVPVSTAETAR